MSYPPEADMYQEWTPTNIGTPQEIDEYLDYLANIWSEEEKWNTSPKA